jgi:hypothetical protein
MNRYRAVSPAAANVDVAAIHYYLPRTGAGLESQAAGGPPTA